MCEMTDMTWSEDDKWTSELTLSPGSYDFKLVILREDGSVAAWEPGENRTVTVSVHGLFKHSSNFSSISLSSSYQAHCTAGTRPAYSIKRTRQWYCTHARNCGPVI